MIRRHEKKRDDGMPLLPKLGELFGPRKKEFVPTLRQPLPPVKIPARPEERWNEFNCPQGYILGVTPGFTPERERLGLAPKIVHAARLGFEFAEIDFQYLAEMYEAELKKQVERIKEVQGLEIGIHAPVELDLCLAQAFEWKKMHDILRHSAYATAEILKGKFYLFHTSSNLRPHITFWVGRPEPRVQQFSHDGINLGEFMEMFDSVGEFKGKTYEDPKRGPVSRPRTDPTGKPFSGLKDWFKAKFIVVLYHTMGVAGDVGIITHFDTSALKGKGFEEAKNDAIREYRTTRKAAWDKVKAQMIHHYESERTQALARVYARLPAGTPPLEQLSPEDRKAIEKAVTEERRLAERKVAALRASTSLEDIFYKKELGEPFSPRETEDLQTRFTFALNEGKNPHEEVTRSYLRYGLVHHIKGTVESVNFDDVYRYWREHGSECEEAVAYRVVAKYMWITQDPIWLDIVGNYDPDKIIKAADDGKEEAVFEGKKLKVAPLVHAIITAVACKYIQGHLFMKKRGWGMKAGIPDLAKKEGFEEKSVYEFTKEHKIQIFIETAFGPEGTEGELRIMTAADHVKLAKHLDDGEFTTYNLDFEHLTANWITVDADLKTLEKLRDEKGWDIGRFIRMIHCNAPRPPPPRAGAHGPVYVLSHDMYILYSWLFKLRQLGVVNTYIIWEMGRYGVDQSGIAFRNLVAELVKGTDPNALPAEFYGLGPEFEAQQLVAVREHAADPLAGLVVAPEEEWTLLTRAASERGKAEVWARERFR